MTDDEIRFAIIDLPPAVRDASPSFQKASERLPCPACGSEAEPLYMKAGLFTVEWLLDADPWWGCANCGHVLGMADIGEKLPYTPQNDARWGGPLPGA